jgi:hypothetical protein
MPTDIMIPYFDDGDNVTAYTTAPVVGKTFVDISGNLYTDLTFSVATAAAGSKGFGVAEYDAATGQWVGIVRKGIVPITCTAVALVAGVEVEIGANGQVQIWGGTIATRPVGKCLTAAAPSTDAMIALYR